MIRWDKILELAIPAALTIIPAVLGNKDTNKNDYPQLPTKKYTQPVIVNSTEETKPNKIQSPIVNINIYTNNSKPKENLLEDQYKYHYTF